MKYCVDYDKRFNYLDEIDEIRINYMKQKAEALQYIQKHPQQCVILIIDDYQKALDNKDLEKLSNIAQEHPELNFKVEFMNIIDNIQDYNFNFKYFFNIYVDNWDTLIGLINLGVSDVYIINELGFELNKIAEIAHKNNIKIRCFANIAQSSWKKSDPIKKFFIRPEDIQVYERYIDIIYFIGKIEKINIYYKIYKYDKKWYGNLNEIIAELDEEDKYDFDSRYIIPRFAETRIKCGKKCLKGGKCQICERVMQLANSLKKANLIVTYNENNEEEEK